MANDARWDLPVLDSGRCEPLKAGVHALLLMTISVCAAYNAAAWLKRRERHLAVNTLIYSAALWWERCHIVHHLAACPDASGPDESAEDLKDAA